MKKIRALVLFSGGLDSMLTVKVLEAQGIEVEAITFESLFFSADKARESAKELSVRLRTVDVDGEILNLVKKPRHGHGKHLNPCLDCRALMVKQAGALLDGRPILLSSEGGKDRQEFDFLASGEVLGQRPFSQNKTALLRMLKIGGLEILRPLSAKLLPETEAEKKKLVNRELLLDLNGRGRDRQMKLARDYGFLKYPSPDGGCLLTQGDFSNRLSEMLGHWPECTPQDARLLKCGRPYWFALKGLEKETWVLATVGRSKEDNESLRQSAKADDIILELKDYQGPVCLLRGVCQLGGLSGEKDIFLTEADLNEKMDLGELKSAKNQDEILTAASRLTAFHYPRARGKKVIIKTRIIN
jgi:tRNA-uridine 2-sulfurtransferase